MDLYVKKLTPLAQIVLARLLVRKRKWFNIIDHLRNYSPDYHLLLQTIEELRENNMLVLDSDLPQQIVEDYFNKKNEDFKSESDPDQPILEPIAEFLDSFTSTKLQEILKYMNTAIKNVEVENMIEVKEISLNPLLKYYNYIQSYYGTEDI